MLSAFDDCWKVRACIQTQTHKQRLPEHSVPSLQENQLFGLHCMKKT